jgi:hypothetical protein
MELLYLRLAFTSLIGMAHQILEKSSSMEDTAKKANLIYEGTWVFIKRDWKAIVANLLTIVVTFLFFGGVIEAVDKFVSGKTYHIVGIDIPLAIVWYIFVEVAFYSTGYFGQDWILRRLVKSVQNRLIKEAIDHKTNIADKASGTLNAPTPV